MMFKVGKNKLATISFISVLIFGAIYGTLLLQNDRSSDAATATCYGQAATHTSIAPKSVTPGQTFKITNITGSANTNVATVNSVTITYTVANATPSTVVQTWDDGPVHGDYTSSYPDVTLKATGKAGDTITMRTKSIAAQVTIASVNQTLTCSEENGQLTANNPGETLTVASVKIVAPKSNSSSTGSDNGSSSGSTTTNKKSKTSSGTKTSSSDQSSDTEEDIAGQSVEITVLDHKGQPVKDAKVIVDSIPAVKTNEAGKATLNELDAGDHNLSVTANGQTITQVFKATDDDGTVLAVSVRMPKPSQKLRNIMIGAALGLVALIVAIVGLIKLIRRKPPTPTNTTPEIESPMPDEPVPQNNLMGDPTVVQPTDPTVQPEKPTYIPTEPPQLNNDSDKK